MDGLREEGLWEDEVRERVLAGRANTAPPSAGRTWSQILRANLLTRFNAILGALFLVVVVVGPVQDGLFGLVLVTNAAIGIVQEARAKRTLDRLTVLTAPRAHVRRRGGPVDGPVVVDLPVEEVVIDDILELRPGDQVPVDAVVLGGDGLELDEALVSGESEPVGKAPGDGLLSGTFLAAGTGTARATAVGGAAYALRLQAEARRFSLVRSELQAGTNSILRLVTWVMVPVGVALAAGQLLRSHQSIPDALRASVAGVGAMVPEGLVLLTSVAFTAGALRLARRRVLVQEPAALEGLARVDVLCIDKTGTLTAPGMHLEAVEPSPGYDRVAVRVAAGALAAADPAPNATLQAVGSACPAPGDWVLTGRVPFSSDRKWSAASFEGRGSWVLGAPGIVAGVLPPALERARARQEDRGRRVLLLARAPGEVPARGPLPSVEPVGLLVLAEELRPEAAETIGYLLGQGVTVKVLSGDSARTVAAVAAEVGIPVLGPPCDGSTLADDGAIAAALLAGHVFGRVRPDQKLAAVRALQDQGHVVAMVGDGVNDVPALKQADLAVAMGSGSQASRSVARIVLLDSSFAAVPFVLAEGRRVIANIERVANLFVTKSVYAAVLATAVAVGGIPFPFFPRHLTMVSSLTIGVPGFFLALAGGTPRATPGFVRRVITFTLPAGVIAAGATFTMYALARASPGVTLAQSRTAAMLELCAVATWVLTLVAQPLHLPRLLLVASMIGALSVLFAVPLSRHVLALALPPVPLFATGAGVFVAAAGALIATRRWWTARTAAGTRPRPDSPRPAGGRPTGGSTHG